MSAQDLTAFAVDGWRSAGVARMKNPHLATSDAWCAWQAGAYARQLEQLEPVACSAARGTGNGLQHVGIDGAVYSIAPDGDVDVVRGRMHAPSAEKARLAHFKARRRNDPADVGLFSPPTLI